MLSGFELKLQRVNTIRLRERVWDVKGSSRGISVSLDGFGAGIEQNLALRWASGDGAASVAPSHEELLFYARAGGGNHW